MEIDQIVTDVLGSHEKAKSLAKDAIASFQSFKTQTIARAVDREREAREHFKMHSKIESGNDQEVVRLRNVMNTARSKVRAGALLDSKVWEDSGYASVNSNLSKEVAKEIIKSISLESFRLRNDAKKDILVAKYSKQDEARTRIHVGVRNLEELIEPSLLQDDPLVDSNVILYYNLGALSYIALDIDTIDVQVDTLDSLLSGDDNPLLSIEKMRDQVTSMENFETIADLATRTAALETEASVQKILSMVGSIKYALKEDLIQQKSQKLIDIMQEESTSHQRIMHIRDAFERERVWRENEEFASVSSIMEVLNAIDGLLLNANSTGRYVVNNNETS